jgi:putative FmdB family regulatory protein
MPIYEYVCEEDGTTLELIRPMAEADKPLPDPENKGRTFKRKLSTFSALAASSPGSSAGACCPCGKNRGACQRGG